jgi:hypothetical protein
MSEPAVDPVAAESLLVAGLLRPWIVACHAGARRRNEVDFRCAADIHDLWRWLQRHRWGTSAGEDAACDA